MYKNLLCVALALFALTGSALAELTQCYDCDGTLENCNSPVDTSKLDICTRSTKTMLPSSIFKNLNLNPDSLTPVSAGEGFTCATVIFPDSMTGIATLRYCAYETVDGLDLCTYVKQNVPEITSCETCNTDLCNYT